MQLIETLRELQYSYKYCILQSRMPIQAIHAHGFELSTEVIKFYRIDNSSAEELHFYRTVMVFIRSTRFILRKS